MSKLVKIKLHGDLANHLPPEWDLSVNSAKEAIYAINKLTKNAFSNYFINNDKLQAKYRVLINGKDFGCPEREINESNFKILQSSELNIKSSKLETVDIVPFIESSDSKILGIITLVVGVILIATGVGAFGGGALIANYGTAIAFAGLTLAAAGAFALLSRPPDFQQFKEPEKGKQSFLFNGPVNTIGEGGPVPVGYGRVLVGSQVISVSRKIQDYEIPRN